MEPKDAVRIAIERNGFSKEEAAKHARISDPTLRKVLLGKAVNIKTMGKLRLAFPTLNELLDGTAA
jgi:predicted transcriptional regulator